MRCSGAVSSTARLLWWWASRASGKTVLGTQLLLEGVAHQKRGLMVSLDEHPEQVMRNADTLGLNLRQHLDSGAIQFLYDCPRELELDVHFARITRTIEEHQIERLVVDGMTSYTGALEDEQQYREFVHALVSYSKEHLMTTFLNYENPELFGVNQFMPDFPVSSIVDNIVLLNFVELGNTLHRAITVAKARGSANQFVTREFTIGPGGITLVPVDAAVALPVLPFQSYYGLLSRAPTRLSPALPRGPLRPTARKDRNGPRGCATHRRSSMSEPFTTPQSTIVVRAHGATRWGRLCPRPCVPRSSTRRAGVRVWTPMPTPRTWRWPWSMRRGTCWGRAATPSRRGVGCMLPRRRQATDVPSPWRRAGPACVCGTPWPDGSWSWRAIARGWCISPCRWCWKIILWGRCSPAKCSTSTRNNCCWSTRPRAGAAAQAVWQVARLELPVKRATLRVYGRLLATLGQAFLQARYHTLLDAQRLEALEQRFQERTTALHHEIAERQRLEREAQRAEHFALLGRLAAGVSHEIRNPLGAIFLHVDLLTEELQQPSPGSPAVVTETLAEIKTQLGRLDDLVQDYLSLVRVGAIELVPEDLGRAMQVWATEFHALAAPQGVSLQLAGPCRTGGRGVACDHIAPRGAEPGAERPRRYAPGGNPHSHRPAYAHARAAPDPGYRQRHQP